MSTRSVIGKIEKDGVRAIYCHGDGYIENNGKILFGSYKKPEQVDALLCLGDLSVLGEEIGEKHGFYTGRDGVCTAYCRDREEEEEDTKAVSLASIDELVKYADRCGAAYVYLFAVDRWLVSAAGKDFVPLEKELILRNV